MWGMHVPNGTRSARTRITAPSFALNLEETKMSTNGYRGMRDYLLGDTPPGVSTSSAVSESTSSKPLFELFPDAGS